MPNLTIKRIPEPLLERLRRSAAQNRRSLNSEVLYRLEQSVEHVVAEPQVVLSRIRRLRKSAPLPPLTDEFLEQAIDEGRP